MDSGRREAVVVGDVPVKDLFYILLTLLCMGSIVVTLWFNMGPMFTTAATLAGWLSLFLILIYGEA